MRPPHALLALAFLAATSSFTAASDTGRGAPWLSGFVENRGQWDGPIRFAGRLPGDGVVLTDTGATLTRAAGPAQRHVVRLTWSPDGTRPVGRDTLPGRNHAFLGNDPARWVEDVPWHAAVAYPDVRPGLDVVVRARPALAYDLIVRRRAALDEFEMRCEGADALAVDARGDLLISVGDGVLRQSAPRSWLERADGSREEVPSRFVLREGRRVGFAVDAPDQEGLLVVDPGLVWATHFGTNQPPASPAYAGGALEHVHCDAAGTVTVSGSTPLTDYPATAGAFQPTHAGLTDTFVARLDGAGKTLLFFTYLGGVSSDIPRDHDVSASGMTVVTGGTFGTTFPTTSGALAGGSAQNNNIFVTALSATGGVVFSARIGGSSGDTGTSVAWNDVLGATLGAVTSSADFPTTPGAHDTSPNGMSDAVVFRLSPDGSSLVYSTYLGGSDGDSVEKVRVDALGRTVFGGSTQSPDFPVTPGAFYTQPNVVTKPQGVVGRLDASGSSLDFCSYLGTEAKDTVWDVQIHPAGLVSALGMGGVGIPTTPGAFQPSYFAGVDLYLAQLSDDGARLVRATYFGSFGGESGRRHAIDAGGYVTLAGSTTGNGFPTTSGTFDPLKDGPTDLFVSKLDPTLSRLVYSTYLGGTDQDAGGRMDQFAGGDVVVVGGTNAADFPVTPGVFQPANMVGSTGVVARLDLLPTGVERLGEPADGCPGPPAISVLSMPQVGTGFAVTCVNGPKNGPGLLGVAAKAAATPLAVAGIDFWLDPSGFVLVPITTDSLGSTLFPASLGLPLTPPGTQAVVQQFFSDACAPRGWSASAGLRITVQP